MDCPITGFACLTCDGVCVLADRTQRDETLYTSPPEPASITCPHCHRESWNPNDIEHRFCGICGYHERLGGEG